MTNARPVAPFFTMLRTKLRQPQFYWFLGHFLTLYHYFRYCLSFSSHSIKYYYSRVLFFITITYGIVLYQFYKSGQLKLITLPRQLRSLDNLQYFTMSLILYFCSNAKILSSALVSPVIFSLFHSLNYFKENLLPFAPLNPMLKNVLSERLTFFITNYNEKFLVLAQNSEIVTVVQVGFFLPIALVSLLIRFNFINVLKLVSIVTYAWFFKLRFLQSPQMKLMIQQYVAQGDAMVQRKLPQFAARWHGIKMLVNKLFNAVPC